MTRSEYITRFCKANKCEVVYRYDGVKRMYYVHLYSMKKPRTIDIECESPTHDGAVVKMTEEIMKRS